MVTVALIMAAIRRYVLRPQRLEPSGEAAVILILVFFLMLVNVAVVGFGYAAHNITPPGPPWGQLWPVT